MHKIGIFTFGAECSLQRVSTGYSVLSFQLTVKYVASLAKKEEVINRDQ